MVDKRYRDYKPWGVYNLQGRLVSRYGRENQARAHVQRVDEGLPMVLRHGSWVQDKAGMVTYGYIQDIAGARSKHPPPLGR